MFCYLTVLYCNFFRLTTYCVGSLFHQKGDDLSSIKINKNQLHAVSRTQQGRQRVPCVKTLRSPLSAGFWRHCVLSGRTDLSIMIISISRTTCCDVWQNRYELNLRVFFSLFFIHIFVISFCEFLFPFSL